MLEVAICTEKVVLPALGDGILFKVQRVKLPLEYLVQHLSVCLPLLIQPLQGNIDVRDRNQRGSNLYDAVRRAHLAELRRLIANWHIYRTLYRVASKIREIRSVGREVQGNQSIPHSVL